MRFITKYYSFIILLRRADTLYLRYYFVEHGEPDLQVVVMIFVGWPEGQRGAKYIKKAIYPAIINRSASSLNCGC